MQHGTVNGIMLAMEKYFKNRNDKDEAVILNVASELVTLNTHIKPVYAGTKAAVVHFTKSFGTQYFFDKTRTRVVAVGPCIVMTETMKEQFLQNETEFDVELRAKIDILNPLK